MYLPPPLPLLPALPACTARLVKQLPRILVALQAGLELLRQLVRPADGRRVHPALGVQMRERRLHFGLPEAIRKGIGRLAGDGRRLIRKEQQGPGKNIRCRLLMNRCQGNRCMYNQLS